MASWYFNTLVIDEPVERTQEILSSVLNEESVDFSVLCPIPDVVEGAASVANAAWGVESNAIDSAKYEKEVDNGNVITMVTFDTKWDLPEVWVGVLFAKFSDMNVVLYSAAEGGMVYKKVSHTGSEIISAEEYHQHVTGGQAV